MEDDNLLEMVQSVSRKSKILSNAPVTYSLVDKRISALVSQDDDVIDRFIKNMIIQLITFHSYQDLKLVFLLKEDKNKKWEYLKMLPHVWNQSKEIRFFAYSYKDMEQISKYLEEELKGRMNFGDKTDYTSFIPYYLIITDDYKRVENLKIIKEVLGQRQNLGFSLFCIAGNLMQLPNECATFINIENNIGKIFESESSSTIQTEFNFNPPEQIFFDKICKAISNIPIKYNLTSKESLPTSFGFLEMFNVGLIEQLNILERWKSSDSTISLQTPIGIDGNGRIINLDIHEKYHGPHGLVAGSTGSGKSEFLITYILSLAINYSPTDVAFILIDYKGGGLAGAFQKKEVKLPHLIGTITNIDTGGLQRSLASIESELKKRQVMFNQARDMTDEGTMDIYKYQKLYHEGVIDKPIPHLLIICDEFAELKQQQPEFMDELISVSRIGRSLGVHLILATQKPAGIVNDQIRSNSKFAICLKVQSREDSNDVIKKPDAANLKGQGQFYMQVGNDEYFNLGQSAWSGAPYYPSDVVKKTVDNSMEFISDIGATIKKVDDTVKKEVKNQGEQLTNIVNYIYKLAKQENIKVDQLWLDNIPETIFVDDIRKKYKITKKNNSIISVVGEYDAPVKQKQGAVKINFNKGGNIAIFGNAESGKETFLSTMVYDLMENYTAKEVWVYILDFGTEALKVFKKSPIVGDVVFVNNQEKIDRFFDFINQEIKRRKIILSDYNGDYNLYLQENGNSMPMIVAIINNYEAFYEMYASNYDDLFLTLTREGANCGIVFTLTLTLGNSMRYRLAQNFKQKIALQLNSDDDYYNIFEKVGKKRPSKMFGRGLVTIDSEIYEFQTAKTCLAEEFNSYIRDEIERLNKEADTFANHIPVLPDKVRFEDLEDNLKDLSALPIGISKGDLKVLTYDFKKNFMSIIVSKNIEDSIEFTSHILEEVNKLSDINILLFNVEKTPMREKEKLKEIYQSFVEYLNTEKDKNDKHVLCVIVGLDKFLSDIENKDNFLQTLKKAEERDLSFIIVENATKMKNHGFDTWYKNYIIGDTGIWVGNGFEEQYVINISGSRRNIINNCGISFGYVVKSGNMTLTKLVEMKDKGEDDE